MSLNCNPSSAPFTDKEPFPDSASLGALDHEDWPTLRDSLTKGATLSSSVHYDRISESKLYAQYSIMPSCAKEWSFVAKGRTIQNSFSLAAGFVKPICLECKRFQSDHCKTPWCVKYNQSYIEAKIPDAKWLQGDVYYLHVASRGKPDDIGYFTDRFSTLSHSHFSDFLITQVTVSSPLGWDRSLCLNNMVTKQLLHDTSPCSCPNYICSCLSVQSSEVPSASYAPIDLDEIVCILSSSEVKGRLKAYISIPCKLLKRAYQADVSRRLQNDHPPLLRAIRRGIIEAHVRCYDKGYVDILATEIAELKEAVKSLRLS